MAVTTDKKTDYTIIILESVQLLKKADLQ